MFVRIKRYIWLIVITCMMQVGLVAAVGAHIVNASSFLPITPTTTFAADCLNTSALGGVLVPWYAYLHSETDANGKCHALPAYKNGTDTDLLKTVSLVGIAIIDLLTRISALIALGFLIKGAIQYITSQGEPDGINSAKSTISNAIIGFVLVLLAIGIVQFLGNNLK